MMTILLEGQNLSVSTPHIVAGTKDYLSVEIVRGVDWKGLNLHIFFQLDNKTYELITDGDYIGPSAHINLSAGMWQVSATGYEYVNGQLVMKITTNKIGLSVAPAPPESGEDMPYIPPTSIEQIEAIAQSVRDDADAGLFNGEKGDKGEKGDPGTTDYEQLANKPTKVSEFENDSGYMQGVTMLSYETLFGGEFTVTTATDATHEHPWARSSVTGRLDKRYRYRVTFDGVQYVLPSQLFGMTPSDVSVRVVEYVGDISLFRLPDDGLLNEPFEVPFLVVSEDDPYIEYVDVYTSEAGTHTVLVERQVVEFEKLLNELMYGNAHAPFQWMKPETKYDYFSVGANYILNSVVATAFAFGIANVLAGPGAFATGWGNEASNTCSFSCGQMNKSAGSRAFTEGFHNIATGNNSHAEGQRNIVSGGVGHVEGDGNRSYAVCAHVEGSGNVADATQLFTHIGGVNNATSNESGKTVDITRYNEDGTVNSTATRALGKYAEVIGNGDSDQARSNARTLDWDGNEELAGGLTLGLGTADETHITAAQLKALLALLA